nr:MAG: replication initiator protein [Microvirus sp.]
MPLCKNPYINGWMPCPCGKCIPCLINRKRLWKHRLLLESYCHEKSSFVTLTYTDKELYFQNDKTGEALPSPSLRPRHLRNFLKRIRKAVSPDILRFYGVGEYGDKSFRPHYHIALFGYTPCWYGSTRKHKHEAGTSCCPPCDLLYKKWGHGGIDNGTLENDSAAYIAGYVTKKLTNPNDQKAIALLQGRHPEFARMSNRPGIGFDALDKIAEALLTQHGQYMLTEHGDVPVSLDHGGRLFPLGRYLRQKLRQKISAAETFDPQTGELKYEAKEKTAQAYQEEMRILLMAALQNSQTRKETTGLKKLIKERDAQKIQNIETKHEITKKEKSL